MKKSTVRLPLLAFIAGTRMALGFGAGLLLSGKIPARRRRQVGMALVGLGAATTIPALRAVKAGMQRDTELREAEPHTPSWHEELAERMHRQAF
jgi:hypothetical protein